MSRSPLPFVVWTAALAAACSVAGLQAREKEKVRWSLQPAQVTGARGQTVTVTLSAEIPSGFHIYSLKQYAGGFPRPTKITAGPEVLLAIEGSIKHPLAQTQRDPAFDLDVEYFEKSVAFELPLRLAVAATPGEHLAQVNVDAQLCNERICMDSQEQLALTVHVTAAPAVSSSLKTDPPDGLNSQTAASQTPGGEKSAAVPASGIRAQIEEAKEQGLWSYLWLAMVAGAWSLLTPCVFPMVPITVSFFTKRKHATRARALRDASIFGLGIVLTFSGIGVAFALVWGASGIGMLAANPIVNLCFAALFVVLALNLFGFFELQVPPAIVNALSMRASQGEGVSSLLLMGLVFSLTSFTCTVPFVGTALVSTAQGDWFYPIFGMLGFSAVFATPFFLLALFPAALKSLPRSGGWLNSVKVVMGFLELAAALKFVSNADLTRGWGLFTRPVFLGLWVALALLTALYLLGLFRFAHDSKITHRGPVRIFFIVLFFSLALYLASGLQGKPLGELDSFLPPARYPGRAQDPDKRDELTWILDWDVALAEARATKTPLFVDFTGFT